MSRNYRLPLVRVEPWKAGMVCLHRQAFFHYASRLFTFLEHERVMTHPCFRLSSIKMVPPIDRMESFTMGRPEPTPLRFFSFDDAVVKPGRKAFSLSAMPGP